MEKSQLLRQALSSELLNEIIKHCKDSEEFVDASEQSICGVREKIARLLQIQASLDKNINPTVSQYIQRIIFCLKVR